jgi:hypothetical protein
MAAGFIHNERPQVVQRKHIKQRTEGRCQMSAQPPAEKAAGQIEIETLPLASFIRWVN